MSTRTDTEKHLDAAYQCASGTPAERYNLRRAQVHALLDIADAIRETKPPTHNARIDTKAIAEAVSKTLNPLNTTKEN